MLDIFFTNKIPSTMENWTDELILVASIINEFDGQEFDHEEIVNRFVTISNRVPGSRDSADYRDQYGAYVTYLGLMHHEKVKKGWVCRVNPRVKEYLCGISPDPQAFVRFQMSLFQYPNPIGAAYHNNSLRIEHSSLKKRMEQLESGVKTVPFRMLLRVLIALNDEYSPQEAFLTYSEIWNCLFSNPRAIGSFDVDGSELARLVIDYRRRDIVKSHIPSNALRNLHIFNHTGVLYHSQRGRIDLTPDAAQRSTNLGKIARSIAALTTFFPIPSVGLDKNALREWTRAKLQSGEWATYYSGSTVPLDTASEILQPAIDLDTSLLDRPDFGPAAPLHDLNEERSVRASRLTQTRRASPEETEALREKANLQHRTLVKLLADRLRASGLRPESNIFVDLCCRTPSRLLFEVKSCSPSNLLQQVRKGVSQLYEYRYRHNELQGASIILALESQPQGELEWLVDYLVNDRSIDVCWLEGEDNLACPSASQQSIGFLMNRVA